MISNSNESLMDVEIGKAGKQRQQGAHNGNNLNYELVKYSCDSASSADVRRDGFACRCFSNRSIPCD